MCIILKIKHLKTNTTQYVYMTSLENILLAFYPQKRIFYSSLQNSVRKSFAFSHDLSPNQIKPQWD